jgi:hypothetical protein
MGVVERLDKIDSPKKLVLQEVAKPEKLIPVKKFTWGSVPKVEPVQIGTEEPVVETVKPIIAEKPIAEKPIAEKPIAEKPVAKFVTKPVTQRIEKKNNTKTVMCNSILGKQPCRYGKNCKFAHTAKELVKMDCLFDNRCRCVTKTANGYKNCCYIVCMYWHTSESVEMYMSRVSNR